MRFAFFNEHGRIDSAHNDATITALPPGAVALTDSQWQQRFDLLLSDGQLVLAPVEVGVAKMTALTIKDAITQKRWEVETGGITLPTGVRVATGIDDQNRITSVIANARLAGLDSVSFKAASGWITLTLAELEGVAAAIAMHVQQCFSAERAHHEAIDALELLHAEDDEALQQALEAYDVEQGWHATDLQTPQPA